MTDHWQPLPVRTRRMEGYDTLYEGVPEWLRESLTTWVEGRLTRQYRQPGPYGSQTRISYSPATLREIERLCRIRLNWGRGDEGRQAKESLLNAAWQDPEAFLCAVDYLLHKADPAVKQREVERVETMLAQGGSIWRAVFREGDAFLERRVDETVQAAAEKTMAGQDAAARLLRDAWHSMYGRSPDPSEAYRDAVRAVEAAAKPLITPNDDLATLGKMNGELRAHPRNWTLAIVPGDTRVLLTMMEALWKGQHDRHGKPDPEGSVDAGPEEAEAAVHLAATLVHWFRSGAVQRRE